MKQEHKASFSACKAGQQRQEQITSKNEEGGMLSGEGIGQRSLFRKWQRDHTSVGMWQRGQVGREGSATPVW